MWLKLVLGVGIVGLWWVGWEVPRAAMFQWWAGLLAGISLFAEGRPIKTRGLLMVISWFGWTVLVSWGTINESMWGNYYRNDGLVTLLMGVVLALVIARSWISERWILEIVRLASTVIAILSLGYGLMGETWKVFGNPHLLAGYLVVGLAGIVGLWGEKRGRKDKWINVAVGGIHIWAIWLTQAWLMLGASLVVVGWQWLYSQGKRKLGLGLITVYSLVVLGWVFRPVVTFEAEGRSRIWHRAWIGWQAKPILGWGWARFGQAIEGVSWPYPVRFDVYIDKAHSTLVEVGVTTGIVGLSLYLGIWVEVMRGLVKKNQSWAVVGLAFLLVSQLNVISISTEMLGWIVIGTGLRDS